MLVRLHFSLQESWRRRQRRLFHPGEDSLSCWRESADRARERMRRCPVRLSAAGPRKEGDAATLGEGEGDRDRLGIQSVQVPVKAPSASELQGRGQSVTIVARVDALVASPKDRGRDIELARAAVVVGCVPARNLERVSRASGAREAVHTPSEKWLTVVMSYAVFWTWTTIVLPSTTPVVKRSR